MFPWAIDRIKKLKKSTIMCVLVCTILVQIVIGICSSFFPEAPLVEGALFDNRLTVWLVYYFPLTRFLDILIGYLLGVLYIESPNQDVDKKFKYSLLEIGTLIFLCISIIVANDVRLNADISNPNYNHPNIWWSYTMIFEIPSILLIWIFAKGKGLISKIGENKFVVEMASISAYGFLIHYVVFQYIKRIVLHFGQINTIVDISLIVALIGIPITIGLSIVWKRIMVNIKYNRLTVHR